MRHRSLRHPTPFVSIGNNLILFLHDLDLSLEDIIESSGFFVFLGGDFELVLKTSDDLFSPLPVLGGIQAVDLTSCLFIRFWLTIMSFGGIGILLGLGVAFLLFLWRILLAQRLRGGELYVYLRALWPRALYGFGLPSCPVTIMALDSRVGCRRALVLLLALVVRSRHGSWFVLLSLLERRGKSVVSFEVTSAVAFQ